MASRYWVGGTGTWDQTTTTHWSATSGGTTGASVPTATDDVIFDANAGTGTCTISASAPMRSLVSTGSSIGTLAQAASTMLTIGTSSAAPSNTALDITGFTSYTRGNSNSSMTFNSTATSVQTVKTGTFTMGYVDFYSGNWKLLSALNSIAQLTLDTTTIFDSNSQAITCTNFITNTGSYPKITLGTSVITVTGPTNALLLDGTPTWNTGMETWTMTGTNPTINNNSSGGNRALLGTINFTGTGTLKLGTTYACSFSGITCGGGRTLQFLHGTTTVITSPNGWNINGTAGNLVTVTSDTGAAFTLAIGPGKVSSDYISLTSCTAVGGARFYAGAHSTNVSGNSGWVFRPPAVVSAGGPKRRPRGAVGKPVRTFPSTTSLGFPVPYIGGSYNNQSFEISAPQRWQDTPSIFERSIGARTNAMMWFNNFYDARPSPLYLPNRIAAAGKHPMLTFIPATANGVYDLAGILAGNYDTMIQNWAGYMNGQGSIRFGHEMNVSTIWGASFGASNYIALWKHVRSVWQARETALGLNHIPWFWCANAGTAFDAYYPGDAFCEIIGFDGYCESTASWPTPASIYTPAGGYGLADLEALGSGTKPIILGEIGCGGMHLDRAGWFTALFTLLASHPRVKGFNYWWHNNEAPWDHYQFSLGTNTRDDDPASALAFQAGLAAWAPGVS